MKYELIMQGLTTQFFPPKPLQYQKRYVHRYFFNLQESSICELIFRVNNLVDYIKQFFLFGTAQGLPNKNIFKLVQLALLQE